jgi:hypothetical protein
MKLCVRNATTSCPAQASADCSPNCHAQQPDAAALAACACDNPSFPANWVAGCSQTETVSVPADASSPVALLVTTISVELVGEPFSASKSYASLAASLRRDVANVLAVQVRAMPGGSGGRRLRDAFYFVEAEDVREATRADATRESGSGSLAAVGPAPARRLGQGDVEALLEIVSAAADGEAVPSGEAAASAVRAQLADAQATWRQLGRPLFLLPLSTLPLSDVRVTVALKPALCTTCHDAVLADRALAPGIFDALSARAESSRGTASHASATSSSKNIDEHVVTVLSATASAGVVVAVVLGALHLRRRMKKDRRVANVEAGVAGTSTEVETREENRGMDTTSPQL